MGQSTDQAGNEEGRPASSSLFTFSHFFIWNTELEMCEEVNSKQHPCKPWRHRGQERYCSTSYPRHKIEVSVLPHAPAALTPDTSCTQRMKGRMGPTDGLDVSEYRKISCPCRYPVTYRLRFNSVIRMNLRHKLHVFKTEDYGYWWKEATI
jgi:hypothetical protein